jgi:hypothetical protein
VRRAPRVNPGTDRAALRFARVPQRYLAAPVACERSQESDAVLRPERSLHNARATVVP